MAKERRKNRIGEKLTPSAKLFIGLETAGAIIAALVLIVSAIVYLTAETAGLRLFATLFWPLVLSLTVALTLGITQLLRGGNLLATVSLGVACACLILTVVVIIFECVHHGAFFVVPFKTI